MVGCKIIIIDLLDHNSIHVDTSKAIKEPVLSIKKELVSLRTDFHKEPGSSSGLKK